jgi:hypothetical protein
MGMGLSKDQKNIKFFSGHCADSSGIIKATGLLFDLPRTLSSLLQVVAESIFRNLLLDLPILR